MFRRLLTSDLASLLLRVGLGVIFLGHGLGKVEHGWGSAWEPLFSPETQLIIAWTEVIAGALVLVGLFTRLSAALLAGLAAATGYITLQYVPFIASEAHKLGANYDHLSVGAEYQFALLAIGLSLVVLGGGLLSLDTVVGKLFRRKAAVAESSAQELDLEPVGAAD